MLLTSERQGVVQEAQPTDRVEMLRQIIISQEQREVGYDEAREIGDTLIEFYEILAEETQDEPVE